eukprot:3261022-Alexandrium_andersonii.AAC.1
MHYRRGLPHPAFKDARPPPPGEVKVSPQVPDGSLDGDPRAPPTPLEASEASPPRPGGGHEHTLRVLNPHPESAIVGSCRINSVNERLLLRPCEPHEEVAVSYTHLTLPTICSV